MPTLLEYVSSMFGMEIKRPEAQKIEQLPAVSPKLEDDGAVVIPVGSNYGTFVDFDGTVRTEAELINKYRDMILHPEIDDAVDNIINEAIVTQEGEKTVQMLLDDVDIPENLKKQLEEEFEEVLRLLEFNTKSYEVFRRWYVDGRLYYETIIDKDNIKDGVKELRYLDPRKIRKIREIAKKRDPNMPQTMVSKVAREYYLYSERSLATNTRQLMPQTNTMAVKIAKDSIIHCTSGMTDTNQTMILSYLHKAIRGLNQLRALEDAVVIYRISRAPERRIFYIDVGSLPKMKAEQHLREMMNRHRNKLVYDVSTGEIRDDRRFMTMMEDFWIARREGGKSTEIQTLPGGQNLGELDDVDYFKRKVYKSLNVPISRMESENIYNVGRSAEISRDEIKFAKFIDRLRLKFSSLFLQILEKNVVMKGIMTPDEWSDYQSEIKFKFLRDNYFAELATGEVLMDRLNRLQLAAPFVGKYYSNEWVRKEILKQTDEEIEEMDKTIEDEANNPQYQTAMPGMGMDDMSGGGPDDGMGMPQLPAPDQNEMQPLPGDGQPPEKPPGQAKPNGKAGPPQAAKGAKGKVRKNKSHSAPPKKSGAHK